MKSVTCKNCGESFTAYRGDSSNLMLVRHIRDAHKVEFETAQKLYRAFADYKEEHNLNIMNDYFA